MANEYLQRTLTSSGNGRVFTWSGWVKKQQDAYEMISFSGPNTVTTGLVMFGWAPTTGLYLNFYSGSTSRVYKVSEEYRDFGSWLHYQIVVDTTQTTDDDRLNFYINGVQRSLSVVSGYAALPQDYLLDNMTAGQQTLLGVGRNSSGNLGGYAKLQLSDIFFVDGQALTPDVFGFYKDGDGYMSSGTTQATDFRPGQWSPRLPKSIKYTINRSGGFGVNGFYLPMNDSSNFGADFHCEPNSIITLKGEDLPQPRNGAPTTTDAFVSELRTDPFAANLILACPFVSGGFGQNGAVNSTIPGLGDYHIALGGPSSIPAVNFLIASGNQAQITGDKGLYYGSSLDVTNNSINPRATVGTAFTPDGDYTVEFWAYINTFNAVGTHLVQYDSDAGQTGWVVSADAGTLRWMLRNSSNQDVQVSTPNVVKSGQWNHFAGVYESSKNTMTAYLNGVAVGTTAVASNYLSTQYTNLNRIHIGSNGGNGSRPMEGYMSDLRIYKGVAKYKGGFDVPRPYTPVGIESWRAVPDTTANNFATLNPLSYQTTGTYGTSYPVLSNGNLTFKHGQTGQWERSHASFGVGEGKWYYEFQIVTRPEFVAPDNSENWAVGVRESDSSSFYGESDGFEDLGDHIYWIDSGTAKIVSNQDRAAGSTSGISNVANGDIINIAFEKTATTLKVWFGINGTYFNSGNPSGGTTPAVNHSTTTQYIIPSAAFYQYTGGQVEPVGTFNFGQNPSFSGQVTAGTNADDSGKGLFKYQPPSGFLSLCEDNLPTPAISDPGEHFKTVLYEGDNSSGRRINVGFQPDLVWFKSRNTAVSHVLIDSVRGLGHLNTNSNGTESTSGTLYASGYANNGFDLNDGANSGGNTTGRTYVAWCWKAGGAAVSNTDGSITSQVSVNQDAGFSIVSYTGNSSSPVTIGHGLGKKPSFIIVKNRDLTSTWYCYHSALGATKRISLESTAAAFGGTGLWNNTEPSSTVFTTVNDPATNNNGSKHIAYCWAEIEGFSKFGSYVANASDDGPFVYCGFKPAFIMFKNADATGNWVMSDSSRDSNNPVFGYQVAEGSAIEERGTALFDSLSNGFKIRNAWTSFNGNTNNIIFMAFAESPFQTANAK
jgi:hypothetical protein